MLTQDQLDRFHREGYLKGDRVLSEQQTEELQNEVLRVLADKDDPNIPQPIAISKWGGEGTAIWQIVNIWEASDAFRRLIRHPVINEEMAQLTGSSTLRIWHDQIQYKPAEGGGVNMWHQDAPIWSMIGPFTEVSAWVALDDVDVDNGCMSMVPGSHLWGNHLKYLQSQTDFDGLPAEFEGHKVNVVTRPVKRGEVHYHHALTWHGSCANQSGRPRRAIALHYMTDETRFVASGHGIMKPHVEVADGEIMKGEHFPLVWPQ